ncbi:hypothetical protein [Candidatus Nitronereus thalassa]|uniref:Uncharacterized protein n=1 Tax=Candidatus Nitronereus thalassa TaxID=3020898 RepID=A0ABU3KBK2_9BACT|nr:hypothetical protein [Candidatus Nitronereus thalassa]MDT7043678.1 hypothetical protein [Candidatus Nitronereus thalassa]
MKHAIVLLLFATSFLLAGSFSPASSEDLVVRPHVPMGHKLPIILPPKGEAPDPNEFPREEGKVSLQIVFETEKGLDLPIKQFLTSPQDPKMLWQDRSIPAHEVDKVEVPIMGDLDTGKGAITTPVSLPPGYYFITLVVDNRKGKEDIQFYVPAPNPKDHILLSWDTSSIAMLNVVAKCLCASIVYTAPKGGIWYRVIGININKDIPVPSRMAFVMTAMKGPRALQHDPKPDEPIKIKME